LLLSLKKLRTRSIPLQISQKERSKKC